MSNTSRQVLSRISKKFARPADVQSYLDSLVYNIEPITRSACGVIVSQTAHCFDGSLFAAAALEQLGHEPLLMDLFSNGNDDNHVLAIYRYRGHFGAVAKSNYVGIRFREPIYRTLRELALSYFHHYVTLEGDHTLAGYSSLFRLSRARKIDWRYAPVEVDLYQPLSCLMDGGRKFRLYPKGFERIFSKADQRLIDAEALGLDKRGIFGAG
ncbi:MAG: hypothetical protein KDD64_07890 [Bdellovibrionales bacterium]|nr:hypothetical protein [Bdellovibrionales bacterium]